MPKNPRVCIIILNWNQPDLTINCVKSVLKQTYQDFEIILVDNGSKDNSVKKFKEIFSKNLKIKIIENGRNEGFAGGNNIGVKNSNKSSEYVVFLNNDTIVDEKWLEELVKAMDPDKEIGAAMSDVYIVKDLSEIKKVKKRKNHPTISLLGRNVHKKPTDEKIVETFYPTGCSLIYRKNLVDEPFDSDYFIYNEDVYLGWLLRLKGFKINIITDSLVYHFHNITKKQSREFAEYSIFLGERNRLLNILTFYDLKNLIKLTSLLIFDILTRNILEPKKIFGRAKSYFWIIYNINIILEKRKKIQLQREVPDSAIIKNMSCKFFENDEMENKFSKSIISIINSLFYFYCYISNLRTIEFFNK